MKITNKNLFMSAIAALGVAIGGHHIYKIANDERKTSEILEQELKIYQESANAQGKALVNLLQSGEHQTMAFGGLMIGDTQASDEHTKEAGNYNHQAQKHIDKADSILNKSILTLF